MSQKSIEIFIDEICSKGPKKNYITNKTDVYHSDDIWSLGILDLTAYGPENKRGHRHVSVIIDNSSKYVWKIPLKTKTSITKKTLWKKFL